MFIDKAGRFRMTDRRKTVKCSCAMAAVLLIRSAGSVWAGGLSLEGTTSFSTRDVTPDIGTAYSALEVEKIYVEAGDTVHKGDALLKLTGESYQGALDYYGAAIVRAENDLVQAQLTYDRDSEELAYTADLAQAGAQLAPGIRAASLKELEQTISGHEEMLEQLQERMSEVSSGIDAGSYEGASAGSQGASQGGTSSGGGGNLGGSGGSSAANRNTSGSSDDQKKASANAGTTQSEKETESSSGNQAQNQSQTQGSKGTQTEGGRQNPAGSGSSGR